MHCIQVTANNYFPIASCEISFSKLNLIKTMSYEKRIVEQFSDRRAHFGHRN